jgi:hypothetical protein
MIDPAEAQAFPEHAITATVPKRRAAKTLDERIDALSKKAALLRQQREEKQRKDQARRVQVLGSALLAMMEEDAALRATMMTRILAQVQRPADRELLHQWLASFPV